MYDRVPCIARGKEHAEPGPAPARLIGKLAAVNAAGQPYIGKKQPDRGVQLDQAQGRRAIGASTTR